MSRISRFRQVNRARLVGLTAVIGSVITPALLWNWAGVDRLLAAASLALAIIAFVGGSSVAATAEHSAENLPRLLTELAARVRVRWEDELVHRGLTGGAMYSLRLAATNASASVSAPTCAVRRLAAVAPGRVRSGNTAPDWQPHLLDGRQENLADRYRQIPTRRLAIVGDSGAGKTVVAIHLVLDLLAARETAQAPVPVLVDAGSWDPTNQSFWAWFEAELVRCHPALGAPVSSASGSSAGGTVTAVRRLRETGLLLPVIDGLDTLAPASQTDAIRSINRALRAGDPLVVIWQTAAYAAAISPDGAGTPIEATPAVEVLPLDGDEMIAVLDAAAGTDPNRWSAVCSLIATSTTATSAATPSATAPLVRTLSLPLMLSLARSNYHRSSAAHPAELCDQARFPDQESIEKHLLDGLIGAVYPGTEATTRSGNRRSAWNADQALRFHRYLARRLVHEERPGATPVYDLAWWRLGTAGSRLLLALVTGILAGTAATLIAGLAVGVADGTMAAFIQAYAVRRSGGLFTEPRRVALTWPATADIRTGLLFALPLGALGGILAGCVYGLAAGLGTDPVHALTEGVAGGVAGGLAGSVLVTATLASLTPPADLTRATAARALLRYDRLTGLVSGTATGLAVGLAVTVVNGAATGLAGGISVALVGLASTRSSLYSATVCWLALTGRTPLRLMAFLDDARRRTVLRKAGPYYQYRHAALQRRLATREPTDEPRP
ncbi:hypothetical protein CcI49_11830 [Frankia sp. CcI49]|uniref:hypothetical protein n=1 Tax=Frankia sp. CcI49 TaxID=1745382 RepID=UPI000976744A|nr:hypothetical protein [Frankia sp. CcI49]ONH60101.1 hypothetical protein CcI49_11830 [Frankia sp. CcI49]